MATRTIYSCDWCGVDSNRLGSVGDDWQILRNDGSLWICKDCSTARTEALEQAELQQRRKKKT